MQPAEAAGGSEMTPQPAGGFPSPSSSLDGGGSFTAVSLTSSGFVVGSGRLAALSRAAAFVATEGLFSPLPLLLPFPPLV